MSCVEKDTPAQGRGCAAVVLFALVLVVVALLAVGCQALHVPVKSGTDSKELFTNETCKTQPQSLPTGNLQHGSTGPVIVRPGSTGGYCAKCHVSNDAAVTLKHARYASHLGKDSSLFCP